MVKRVLVAIALVVVLALVGWIVWLTFDDDAAAPPPPWPLVATPPPAPPGQFVPLRVKGKVPPPPIARGTPR